MDIQYNNTEYQYINFVYRCWYSLETFIKAAAAIIKATLVPEARINGRDK